MLVGLLNGVNWLHSVSVYKNRSIRNTGEIFLLAPAISNPKYAPAEDKEAEAEVATKPQNLFGFTYKPVQNVPEELTYQEEFVAKLSSKVNFETFELREDGYPPIFAVEASEKGRQGEKDLRTPRHNWSRSVVNLK